MSERRTGSLPRLARLLVMVVCVLLVLGRGTDPVEGLGWVIAASVYAGGPAVVVILASLGYGTLLGRVVLAQAPARTPVEAGLGLAFMFTAAHGLGVLGVLTTPVAIALTAIGLAVFVRSVVLPGLARSAGNPWGQAAGWVVLPAVAILAVAASCAPGRLWDSEFGGYDALSYHLPIVQEWLARGRIEPLTNNVYSYLPSYVESMYHFLGVLTDAPGPGSGAGGAWGLVAGDGWRVLGAQWFHAGLTVLAAWMIGRVTAALAERAGLDSGAQRVASGLGVAMTLTTPWVLVVGSLAYNEMAVVALGAGALGACMLVQVRPIMRGAIVGVLVGAACGAKPTAIFMLAPSIGVVMLALSPRKQWVPIVIGAGTAGALMLAPWMLRNWANGGNPVFPYATGLFGSAHWTSEQVERFAGAHHFDGSIFERLRVGFWTDPSAPAGARSVVRFRGLSNPQWGALFFVAAGSLVVSLVADRGESSRARRVAALLGAGLVVQVAAWLLFTHIQSRFLLPCIVFAAPLFAVVCASRRCVVFGSVVGTAIAGLQVVMALWLWSVQAGGYPTAGMIGGVRLATGDPFVPEYHAQMPTASTNRIAQGQTVCLVGGATPLYFTSPVLYWTTWDTSLLGQAMREAPDQPERWARALRARGVVYLLVNYAELDRLGASKWSDPLLTSERVARFAGEHARVVVGWPNFGQVLYRLDEAGGAP